MWYMGGTRRFQGLEVLDRVYGSSLETLLYGRREAAGVVLGKLSAAGWKIWQRNQSFGTPSIKGRGTLPSCTAASISRRVSDDADIDLSRFLPRSLRFTS
jgi:hypothetical protein